MTFKSTRGGISGITFSEAVLKGIAPDGGLFVPEEFTTFNIKEIEAMTTLSYPELAYIVLKQYASDFSESELKTCIDHAYGSDSKFEAKGDEHIIANIAKISNTVNIMELWHGPTSAFKDVALQILPEFMSVALKKRGDGKKIAILTATSGDTGKAALEGFCDVPGIDIVVFYPQSGVSKIQELQMVTQEGKNVSVVAVKGNFDDAQTGVKKIFTDGEYAKVLADAGIELSSANSINIGRLVPQIVYYFYAYAQMAKSGEIKVGDKINFVVPTGNFGDILACYYAHKMGLPINEIICATNENKVVTDFIMTGTYDARREFKLTISPAMDILISSNLERLLYDASGDSDGVARVMTQLKENGSYTVTSGTLNPIQSKFWAQSATEDQTVSTIRNAWNEFKYLVDPHTAVACEVYDKYVISRGDITKTVVVSTASPFKFNRSVLSAISAAEDDQSEFEVLRTLSRVTGWTVPTALSELEHKGILHERTCDVGDMKDVVSEILMGRK